MKIEFSKHHPNAGSYMLGVFLLFGLVAVSPETGWDLFNSPFEKSECSDSNKDTLSWKTSLVSSDEPGLPLVVSGTVHGRDGKTPLEGVLLYVYHTDADGYYSKSGTGSSNPRIKGWMRTNAQGRYEFRTIKPASYPGRRIPAHIHAKASGAGYAEQWIDEFQFDGDPFLTRADYEKHASKGNFSSIMKLTRDKDGTLRGARDIRLGEK